MELLTLIAAVFVVLGGPALAAVAWRRTRGPVADAAEIIAVSYSGIAVAALSIWVVAGLAGLSSSVVLFASLAGAAMLAAPAIARRPWQEEAPDSGVRARSRRVHLVFLTLTGAVFALLVYVPFLTFGWERADGVHRMAMTDWYKHLVTTTALTATDTFPPANPFLQASDTAPYYYGFHLVGASVARLAGALAGAEAAGDFVFSALLALTLWTAFATPFVAYTVARSVASRSGDRLGEHSRAPLLAALGGTLLAGFDLIPLALDTIANVVAGSVGRGGMDALRGAIPSTHLDYWIHHNERQFNAPYITAIWAPQHMAGVLVALLVVHFVLQRRLVAERGRGFAGVGSGWLLPALLLAGLPALSAYVALGLAGGVFGATLIESVRRRLPPWRTAAWEIWWLPSCVAAVLSLPVARVLGAGAGPGFVLHVSDAGRWVNGAVWSALFGSNWLTGLLDTVAVYVVEFGVIGLLAFAEIRQSARRRSLSPHQQHVVAMVVALLVFVVLIRPPLDGPNNLYARPLVFAWFLLAPFAAMRFARSGGAGKRSDGTGGRSGDTPREDRPTASPPARRRGLAWTTAAVIVCLAANGYALLGVVLEGALFWAAPVGTVEAAQWVNDNAPPDAVVAIPPDDFVSTFGYWLQRRLALADERHALLFGATAEDYERVSEGLRQGVAAGGVGAAASVDAAEGTYLVLSRGRASTLRSPLSPCFEQVYGNEAWIVLSRVELRCAVER